MRLLHTSDWHLGRSLLGISLLEDQAAFVEHLVELTHDFQPDLVIILGDLFDGAHPSDEVWQLLDQLLQRLVLDCKTRVLLAPGQQDHSVRLNFASWLYDRRQVMLVSSLEQCLSPVGLEDADGPVQINIIPFLSTSEVQRHFRSAQVQHSGQAGQVLLEHLTRFRRLRRKALRGVLAGYLRVEGALACGEELSFEAGAPNPVPESAFEGIQYAALGSLHRHQVIQEHLVYSGSPFCFSFETEPIVRGVVRLEMDGQGSCRSALVPFPVKRRFYRLAGSLEQLLLGPPRTLEPQDLTILELESPREMVTPELLLKLRGLYPNLWRLQPSQPLPGWPSASATDPLESFQNFYREVTQQNLDSVSLRLLRQLIWPEPADS